MKNKEPGKRRARSEGEREDERERGTKPKDARKGASAAKPAPGGGAPPWPAFVAVGGVIALVAWSLARSDGSHATKDDAGAAATSGELVGDGGLGIEDVVVGTGAEATQGDTVKVHYVGTLPSGKEFDSSRKHGEPFDFHLGAGEVIPGWDQGVLGMKVGGKRKLVVPAKLGYGTRGSPPVIPPNATLLFEIELLAVTKGNAAAAHDEDDNAPPANADDPLKGSFTLADATKHVKGTGALTAKIETSLGTLTCRLLDDKAPVTVANFIGLATGERTWKDPNSGKWVNKPAYDGTTFHRIIKGFMIQGGDPKGNGSGEPGYVIKDEIWEGAKHDRLGLLCMANRGPNTNGAQFFITEDAKASLDGKYTIFGECAPAEVIHDIAKVPTDPGDKPETPVIIKSVKIARVAKP
jgi:peptidyl-prolyl cis-trans isomerase A (cyclophilin A)